MIRFASMLGVLLALASTGAGAQTVAPIYVPDMGKPSAQHRFPDRIVVPSSRTARAARPATVPSPIDPGTRIEVPGTDRDGENMSARFARCHHAASSLGVAGTQQQVYIHRCAAGY